MGEAEWATEIARGKGQRVENGARGVFNPVSGYSDQDWNPVQLEINSRVRTRMLENKQLNWQAALQMVMNADPSLAVRSWDAINVELSRRVKAMLAQSGSQDYGAALRAVMNDDPNFARDYLAAKGAYLARTSARAPASEESAVDSELLPLVKEKIAASEGKTSYGEALRLVLSERPDLARRRKATMQGARVRKPT